jgi:hypothetical protein
MCGVECYGGCNFTDFVASEPCAYIWVRIQRRAKDKVLLANGTRYIAETELVVSQMVCLAFTRGQESKSGKI